MKLTAGEEKTREILGKIEESTSSANPISTPAVEKVIDALKTSCADLYSVVEDLLLAAKAVADEVLAARMDKRVSLNVEEVGGQQQLVVLQARVLLMIKTMVQVEANLITLWIGTQQHGPLRFAFLFKIFFFAFEHCPS
jgi:hypothetical protein